MSGTEGQGLRANLTDGETISLEDWLTDTSVSKGTRRNRGQLLREFEAANKRRTQEILKEIKAGRTGVYEPARKMVDHLRRKGLKPTTVYQLRSMLPGLLQSTLGEECLTKTKFDRLVPAGDYFVSTVKLSPEPDELRHMLRLAKPEYRALLGVMACTGARTHEIVSRRKTDLAEKDGIGLLKFQPAGTKARTRRYAFLTREVMEWLGQFHAELDEQARHAGREPTPWLFPGERGEHLTQSAAYRKIKRLLKLTGLVNRDDEVYSPHSFRLFADVQMAKCGLDRKYIAAIIGHKGKLAAEASYLSWKDIEEQWKEKCAEKMCWLSETQIVIQPDPKLKADVENLKQLVLWQIAHSNLPYNRRKLKELGISEDEIRQSLEQADRPLGLEDKSKEAVS